MYPLYKYLILLTIFLGIGFAAYSFWPKSLTPQMAQSTTENTETTDSETVPSQEAAAVQETSPQELQAPATPKATATVAAPQIKKAVVKSQASPQTLALERRKGTLQPST